MASGDFGLKKTDLMVFVDSLIITGVGKRGYDHEKLRPATFIENPHS
jgi:hypothetical protein